MSFFDETKYTYGIVLTPAPVDGGDKLIVATVPELRGCIAAGVDFEAALNKIKIAIRVWVDAAELEGRSVPPAMHRALPVVSK